MKWLKIFINLFSINFFSQERKPRVAWDDFIFRSSLRSVFPLRYFAFTSIFFQFLLCSKRHEIWIHWALLSVSRFVLACANISSPLINMNFWSAASMKLLINTQIEFLFDFFECPEGIFRELCHVASDHSNSVSSHWRTFFSLRLSEPKQIDGMTTTLAQSNVNNGVLLLRQQTIQ